MNWQEIVVWAIAVVVAIVVARKIWRFFACRDSAKCSSCDKECRHRH